MPKKRLLIVRANPLSSVIIGATGLAGLAQEVRTVLATRKGSVPLDRDFGVSWDILDQPVGAVLPLMVADVGQQVEKYVPRVKMVSVEYVADELATSEAAEGILRPKVVVQIRDEYLADFQE